MLSIQPISQNRKQKVNISRNFDRFPTIDGGNEFRGTNRVFVFVSYNSGAVFKPLGANDSRISRGHQGASIHRNSFQHILVASPFLLRCIP